MRNYSFFLGGLPTPTSLHSVSAAPSPTLERLSPPTFNKAASTSHLPTMATLSTPTLQQNGFKHIETDLPNTIPDPRTPSPSGERRRASDSDPHPDLSNEVAMLSTKLINAINHQTNLDDTLQHTRHEMEAAKQRNVQLEAELKEHVESVTSGVLVKQADVEAALEQMKAELAEAKKEREASDKAKKEMEVELENLTTALFEEANTMVASARRENEAIEKRNSQLKSQLNDTELLLASQQEQLHDLKGVMERLSSERDETETAPHPSTAPSTPGLDSANKMHTMFDTMPMSPGMLHDIPPEQPLHFSHLIIPAMRTDLQAYNDFADLLKSSRAASAHARSASGNLKSANASTATLPSASSSSPSLPGSFMASALSSPRDSTFPTVPALKDNRFYKRCLVEDIEPCLRLDLAPGLSWLARRSVLGAITAGTLMVEPFVPSTKFYGPVYACSLCGEDRRADSYTRRHRFRTSEDETAQRYPLCEYCLGRVRATGDFAGFLRMVRDGLWRAKTEDEVMGAWEEATRLREKMFWARLGGGVVPVPTRDGPVPGARNGETDIQRLQSTASSYYPVDVPRASQDSPELRAQSLAVPKQDASSGAEQRENGSSVTKALEGASERSDTQDFGVIPAIAEAPRTPEQQKVSEPQGHPLRQQESSEAVDSAVETLDDASKPADFVEDAKVSDVDSKSRHGSLAVVIPGSFD